MRTTPEQLAIFISTLLFTLLHALPSNPPDSNPQTYNTIAITNSTCDSTSFNISLLLAQPFNGLFFAKEFSQECNVSGASSRSLILNLPTSGCGVSLNRDDDSAKLYYAVTVILQQDKFLRQIYDETMQITCYPPDNSFQVKIDKSLVKTRKGRMKIDWDESKARNHSDDALVEAMKAARAWMEILPANDVANPGILKVGEPVLLVVKSTLPVGIGWRVIDCVAHDGLGDSSQLLLDQNGCPIDELLLPPLTKKPVKPIAFMKHQEAVSKFAAFKFPDRDRLHLSCGLQFCRDACPQMDCSESNGNPVKDGRLGRILGTSGDILDRMEVFNSVEIRAPEIDLREDFVNFGANYGKRTSSFPNIPGDKTFCVSPSSMALSFCLLGLVFLAAVFVAALSLLRARRIGSNIPYYTRSLFSSSGAGSAMGTSKSLLQESPYMPRQSRNLHSYGRMY